jgi:hypothetical protein
LGALILPRFSCVAAGLPSYLFQGTAPHIFPSNFTALQLCRNQMLKQELRSLQESLHEASTAAVSAVENVEDEEEEEDDEDDEPPEGWLKSEDRRTSRYRAVRTW